MASTADEPWPSVPVIRGCDYCDNAVTPSLVYYQGKENLYCFDGEKIKNMSDELNLNEEELKLWKRFGFSIKKIIGYALFMEDKAYEALKTGKIELSDGTVTGDDYI